jgi:molybdopterin-biosynthesis enzyme MoeA-like protein
VEVDTALVGRFRRDNAWADERIAVAAATFPIDAVPVKGITGGVPGFQLRNAYVLPGRPAEMRAVFHALTLPVDGKPIHRTTITLDTTEDQIAETLKQFDSGHPLVRLGSYPDLDSHPPQVTLVLVSRSPSSLDEAATWLTNQLMGS